MILICIHDKFTNRFELPLIFNSLDEFGRAVKVKKNGNDLLYTCPDDYELIVLGSFDYETGFKNDYQVIVWTDFLLKYKVLTDDELKFLNAENSFRPNGFSVDNIKEAVTLGIDLNEIISKEIERRKAYATI